MIDDLWYKNAIIYCLDVEKYVDANGDGVGDFAGLTQRLAYLAGLGVTCVWLQPFSPSPNKDNGYDVADYYGVHPKHGTLGEYVEFMNLAEQLGVRVIVDLVVNHTSDRHPWFRAARKDPSSPYRDWYVWSKARPTEHRDGIVFPGVQTTTWTRDHDHHGRTLVTLHNFTGKPRVVRLDGNAAGDPLLVDLLAAHDSRADEYGRHTIELPPYGYRWLRAAGADSTVPRE